MTGKPLPSPAHSLPEDDDDHIDTAVRLRTRIVDDALEGAWRLRCTRASDESSLATLLPEHVTVMPDGTALAHYRAAGPMRFLDLAHLMAHHDLTMVDFEELE